MYEAYDSETMTSYYMISLWCALRKRVDEIQPHLSICTLYILGLHERKQEPPLNLHLHLAQATA